MSLHIRFDIRVFPVYSIYEKRERVHYRKLIARETNNYSIVGEYELPSGNRINVLALRNLLLLIFIRLLFLKYIKRSQIRHQEFLQCVLVASVIFMPFFRSVTRGV